MQWNEYILVILLRILGVFQVKLVDNLISFVNYRRVTVLCLYWLAIVKLTKHGICLLNRKRRLHIKVRSCVFQYVWLIIVMYFLCKYNKCCDLMWCLSLFLLDRCVIFFWRIWCYWNVIRCDIVWFVCNYDRNFTKIR